LRNNSWEHVPFCGRALFFPGLIATGELADGVDLMAVVDACNHASSDGRSDPGGQASTRVLHVVNGEHYAGTERVQDLLAALLPTCGFEVGFACLKPDKFPRFRKTLNVPLYEIPMQSRFDLRPIGRLVQLVRNKKYHILHAHTPRAAMLGGVASALTGVPLVYHVHSPTLRDSTRPAQNWVNAIIERASMVQATALIAVSESMARHICQTRVDEKKIFVVHNGVPVAKPRPLRLTKQVEWMLGMVALFRPRKGVEVLLRALAKLNLQGRSVRLRLVGKFETPEYEFKVKRLVDDIGVGDIVEWVGFSQDVVADLTHMDLFVLPSLFGEGLPMVVLEAMSVGVPVVTTRVEGIPEAIRDGLDGLVVGPGNPDDLAWAIARVMDGDADWETLRKNAIQRQADLFSDRAMAVGVAEVYRHVLKAPQR